MDCKREGRGERKRKRLDDDEMDIKTIQDQIEQERGHIDEVEEIEDGRKSVALFLTLICHSFSPEQSDDDSISIILYDIMSTTDINSGQ